MVFKMQQLYFQMCQVGLVRFNILRLWLVKIGAQLVPYVIAYIATKYFEENFDLSSLLFCEIYIKYQNVLVDQ